MPSPAPHTPQASLSSMLLPPRLSIDLSNILIIDNTIALPPVRLKNNRLYGMEIRGDADEVEATLEACLLVQRWDRAFALLRQLSFIYQSGSPTLLTAYNRCLEAMVQDMLFDRNRKNVDRINRWVEVDMKNAGVEPDARTYALKIKAAMATLDGYKRDRTVRRYWELAKQYDLESEVARLRDILSDNDLGKLTEICPMNLDFELRTDVGAEYEPTEMPSNTTVAEETLIEIREMSQKGLGLSSLKKSLSLFSEKTHLENEESFEDTSAQSDEQYAQARQSRLETDAIESAIERWRVEHEKMSKMGIVGNLQHGRIGALLWQWHQLLTEKLRNELHLIEEAESKPRKTAQDKIRCEYGPFLRLLEAEHVAATTTIAVIQIMNKKGIQSPIKLASLVTEIGKIMEAEVEAEQLRLTAALRSREWISKNHIDNTVPKAFKPGSQVPGNSPHPIRHRSPQSSPRMWAKKRHWSTVQHARVGAILCELLFNSAKITVSKEDPRTQKLLHITQPVFTRQFIYQNGRKVGAASLHSNVVDMLVAQPAGDLIAKQLPMVCPPRPWKGFYNGGFLNSQPSFLRIKNSESSQRDYGEAAAARGDLDQVFAGIDVLGRTPWRINRDVFNVMLKAWNTGQAIANLPPVDKVFPEVEKPTDSADRLARFKWYSTMKAIDNERSGLHSNRCFQNFQMEIANAYLDETFYLPHNIDFRGRAYPIPPYLNQMGADNCRGLLIFAKGKPLGRDGLRWLKIHLANVYGYDKASLTDRENFPMEHLADVIGSAKDPLGGRKWWLAAEDPWQCLATCIELKNALDVPDPTRFVSHLPIHQDGSCNGLQHYAALGGDIAGAKQVNLEPGDKPADVYTGVAELVKAEITEDALQGDQLAKALDGKVTRKIVKQTVMTNVYGVTFLGAIRQVRKQVDDLLPEFKNSDPPMSGTVATYVARKIFKALGAMFSGAHDIQYWLGDCANRISVSVSPAQLQKVAEKEDIAGAATAGPKGKSSSVPRRSRTKKDELHKIAAFRSSVIWTTPLKLPVVQPYRVSKARRIKTNMQDITLAEPTIADSVDKRKQLQAFPPNFIHSLDATHMILSALKCEESGLTFSAVHDSFWTHAADVPTLNTLLRDAFIRMHSEDIIGRLAAEFKMRYKGHYYLATVRKGTTLAKKIQTYRSGLSFRKGLTIHERRYEELVREIKRQTLLNSDLPAEREEGGEMVTASSLFAECDGEKYLHSKDSLGETAIGAVPVDTSKAIIEKALQSEDVANDVDLPHTLEPLVYGEDSVEFIDAAELAGKPEKRSRPPFPHNYAWLWLPLTFRDVPKKVRRPLHSLWH